jgi:hypothetical protein
MNLDLVNRALYAAGLNLGKEGAFEPLLIEDKNNPGKKTVYDLCKANYLSTWLEALSEVPWTAARKRKRLLKTRRHHGDSGYSFVYELPYDCARPIELSGKGYYVIEGNFLCTDTEKAELLYVSNGRILPRTTDFQPVGIGDIPHNVEMLLSPGGVDEWSIPPDVIIMACSPECLPYHGGRYDDDGNVVTGAQMPEDWNFDDIDSNCPLPFPGAAATDEDYPEYRSPRHEPKFYEYLEKMLAAKFAVKNTEQPRLHEKLLQEALMIKQDAIASTKSIATAKKEPSPWWADRLGLSGVDI